MFCPNCGTNNLEEAQFCRSCGTNVSLVPQALTGQLTTATEVPSVHLQPPLDKKGRPITKGRAAQMMMTGFGFAALSLALAVTGAGRGWWFWMLIPTFAMFGQALNIYFRAQEYDQRATPTQLVSPQQQRAMPPYSSPTAPQLPQRDTGEIVPRPFSVTEGTTRHLSHEAPTRTFEPKEK